MKSIKRLLCRLRSDESGQDVAEYAVMLFLMLVLALGTISAIGSQATEVFHRVASALQ
jgi:Flp pilus assembly pilin Flp